MEHREHGCYVDHFFSKHYNSTYHAYQIVHDRTNIEQLTVTILLYLLIVDLLSFRIYMKSTKKDMFAKKISIYEVARNVLLAEIGKLY